MDAMNTGGTKPRRRAFDVAVEEFTGRADRHDPVLARTGGPAGNARLTAWTGLVLLILLAIEGATLLDVSELISWHIIVGLLLIPPALLKVGTTGWRIVRYYAGDAAYRQAGPPQAVLRALGPLVVLFTLALLATGLLLTIDGPAQRGTRALGFPVSTVLLHKASFIVWLVVHDGARVGTHRECNQDRQRAGRRGCIGRRARNARGGAPGNGRLQRRAGGAARGTMDLPVESSRVPLPALKPAPWPR